MKKLLFSSFCALAALSGFAQSKVYMTEEITPEALVKVYEALGRSATGKVAVKISTTCAYQRSCAEDRWHDCGVQYGV